MSLAAQFLRAFFNNANDDEFYACLWTPRQRPFFFKWPSEVDKAAAQADKWTEARRDVYFRATLLRSPPKTGRGTAADTAALVGVWADIDIAGPAHRKQGLPLSEEVARKLLMAFGPPPSLLWHSGHGLQAAWLFDEAWVLDTPEERKRAAEFCKRWSDTLLATAAARGLTVDPTGDLARVLRLPGTVNYKAEPVAVRVLEPEDVVVRRTYDPTDLAEFATVVAAPRRETPPSSSGGGVNISASVITPTANPPAEKLVALLSNSEKFRKSWGRARPDLPDQSASAYDLSLATIAVAAGWTDDEVAALLIAWGRQHRSQDEHPDKPLRRDYLERTIALARRSVRENIAEAEAVDEHLAREAAGGGRESTLKLLRRKLGIPLEAVIKRGCRHGARYSFLLDDGREVPIGTSSVLLSPTRVAAAVFDSLDYRIPQFTAKEWRKVVNLLKPVMRVVDLVEDDRATETLGWVAEYIEGRTVYPEDRWAEALPQREPFQRGEKVYVHSGEIQRHLAIVSDLRIEKRELLARLSEAGFETEKVTAWVPSAKQTIGRSYWAIEMAKLTGKDAANAETAQARSAE